MGDEQLAAAERNRLPRRVSEWKKRSIPFERPANSDFEVVHGDHASSQQTEVANRMSFSACRSMPSVDTEKRGARPSNHSSS